MSKLYNTEIAEIVKTKNIIELSDKMDMQKKGKATLTSEDNEAIGLLDNFAREIGRTGKSSENNKLLAEYIKETIEPTVFNPDESILGDMFDIGTIGEFDEKAFTGLPKNTIKVYDAVRGGNVPKSYVDPTIYTKKSFKLQAETELNYSDLRRNGFKSIAKMTELALESFNNEKFYRIFAGVDDALNILSGDQNSNAGSTLTVSVMDNFTRYLRDMAVDGNPFMIGLTKYTDPIARMDGADKFLSEDMKNEFNRTGYLSLYNGVVVNSVPTARKTADNKNLIPDKRIFGIAGKIGEMDIRGDLRNYETYDNDAEKVKLKFTGFDVDYIIYHLDRMARIYFS
jgi:hypothetical protein